jgi:uncharacterized protein (TIGR03083 family)
LHGDMDFERLHGYLRGDYRRLRDAVAASDPAAPVPSCPGWTVAELASHVAHVYLHKAVCIETGQQPKDWPPPPSGLGPADDIDASFAALEAQLAAHAPGEHAFTWYGPDQSVGFWIRRMAQESVVHRVDAELAAGLPVSPIAADLALDGIDEVLRIFFAYGSAAWPEELGDLLAKADRRPVLLAAAEGPGWLVTTLESGLVVGDAPESAGTDADAASAPAALTVSGPADALLLWLWNRTVDGYAAEVSGDPLLLAQFHAQKVAMTQ